MDDIRYDHKAQLNRIEAYLIPNETLHAVFDCKGGGTGFVGITDQRIIFYDQVFLAPMKAMISIPYHRIIAVASEDEGVIFKTSTKAHWAYSFIMNQILNQETPQQKG
jgi:hypothetical protein